MGGTTTSFLITLNIGEPEGSQCLFVSGRRPMPGPMPASRASGAARFCRNAGSGNHDEVASGCYGSQGDPECAYQPDRHYPF